MKPYELFFQAGDKRYSLQSNDGNYYKQDGIVDDNLFNQHLQGIITLGAYTTFQNTCLFGAWDIDINKSIYSLYEDTSEAFENFKDEIVDILKQFHILLQDYPHYMEFSGRKGAHVWIFFEEPMLSEAVFNFLQKMERKIKFRHEIFHIETFPKQAHPNGDGNLIKIPLATHRVTGKKAWWCDPFLNEINLKWEDIKQIQKDNFEVVIKGAGINRMETGKNVSTGSI